jgi:hypothetical protein
MSNAVFTGIRLLPSLCVLTVSLHVAAQTPLTETDRAEIQALMAKYSEALAGCRAEDYANLFVPESGYFASGFRGVMAGHERLVELVDSERHCRAPAGSPQAQRPGNVPTVVIDLADGHVRGVADLGAAEYQDEYAKTPDGWRFASRTVIIAAEKEAGLDAGDLHAIHELAGGDELGDHYGADDNGVRLLTTGVSLSVADGRVTGRAYLKDGGYNDEVYERADSGQWRISSSTYVAAE